MFRLLNKRLTLQHLKHQIQISPDIEENISRKVLYLAQRSKHKTVRRELEMCHWRRWPKKKQIEIFTEATAEHNKYYLHLNVCSHTCLCMLTSTISKLFNVLI